MIRDNIMKYSRGWEWKVFNDSDDDELVEVHRTLEEIGMRLAAQDLYGRMWSLVTCRSSINSLDRLEDFARRRERDRYIVL